MSGYRKPMGDGNRYREPVNLLPELPLEGRIGCVDADGVSPLSRTASLMGEGRAAVYSAIRVVPQRIYDLCLFLLRDKGLFVFYDYLKQKLRG